MFAQFLTCWTIHNQWGASKASLASLHGDLRRTDITIHRKMCAPHHQAAWTANMLIKIIGKVSISTDVLTPPPFACRQHQNMNTLKQFHRQPDRKLHAIFASNTPSPPNHHHLSFVLRRQSTVIVCARLCLTSRTRPKTRACLLAHTFMFADDSVRPNDRHAAVAAVETPAHPKRPTDRPTDSHNIHTTHTLLLSGYTNARYSIIASRIGSAIGRVRCYAVLCYAMRCDAVMRCGVCIVLVLASADLFSMTVKVDIVFVLSHSFSLSLSAVQRCWFYYA